MEHENVEPITKWCACWCPWWGERVDGQAARTLLPSDAKLSLLKFSYIVNLARPPLVHRPPTSS